MSQPIAKVLIVGGGTAGWITAAALAKLLPRTIRIELVESDAIGTVGVGEATIPQIRRLNMILGIDEDEFVRETKGTFKLGIEFRDWGRKGESYIHTFGDVGMPLAGLGFHHYWLRARKAGDGAGLWDFSLHGAACGARKFARMERVGNTRMTGLAYAFHFDAALYALYLRRYAEARGVQRKEGRICRVDRDGESGRIVSVTTEDDSCMQADLFIDCSGFRGILIGETLGVGYRDWSRWLPCNRAVAVPSERSDPLLPYTQAAAGDAGWQWRIPLQHRTGNGHVFCDAFTTESAATDGLLERLDAPATDAPRLLRFTTGRREHFWYKNCVSIGLASGFLEPLESTSIHLVQSNVSRLIELFPDASMDEARIREYNRLVGAEYEAIRDFLILHYHQTRRDDTEFWRYCAAMDIPDTLREKMDIFISSGCFYRDPDDLFREASWLQVMVGQGLLPRSYHPMADRLTADQLRDYMDSIRRIIGQTVDALPAHADFVAQIAPAGA